MTVIPLMVRALGTLLKGLVMELEDLELRGEEDITRTTTLSRLARILGKVLET